MTRGARPLLLACGLALAAGCSGPAATSGRAEGVSAAATTPATSDTPSVAAPAAGKLQRLRGNAVVGKDGYGITLCGETNQRMVGFAAGAQAMLGKFLTGGAGEFFVDGWGGPAAGDHLQIVRFERLYREGPGCKEALGGVAFLARGTEPFWSLSAGQDGVRLERPDHPTVSAPFMAPESSAAGFTYAAQTRTGPLSLQFTPGECSDGMSGTLYGWNVGVTLGDQAYRGCGFAGLPADRD